LPATLPLRPINVDEVGRQCHLMGKGSNFA
jgi:hypothetical protein